MADITEKVLTAVISRLKDQVSDISDRVYFEVPQNTMFPFVAYNFTVRDIAYKDLTAQEFEITFSVYTQRSDASSALLQSTRIASKIHNTFDNYDLTVSDANVFGCFWSGLNAAFTEEDGRTVQHVTRIKIMTTN